MRVVMVDEGDLIVKTALSPFLIQLLTPVVQEFNFLHQYSVRTKEHCGCVLVPILRCNWMGLMAITTRLHFRQGHIGHTFVKHWLH